MMWRPLVDHGRKQETGDGMSLEGLDAQRPVTEVLQLRSPLQMCTSCSGLVGPSPERPGDDMGGLDASLREADGDAADLLDRPADEVWCFRASRIGIFGGAPAIEAEHELVEVVRQMLGADAVMGPFQPRFEVRERPMGLRQQLGRVLRVAHCRGLVVVSLAQGGVSSPAISPSVPPSPTPPITSAVFSTPSSTTTGHPPTCTVSTTRWMRTALSACATSLVSARTSTSTTSRPTPSERPEPLRPTLERRRPCP
jgi:hypothetical protein